MACATVFGAVYIDIVLTFTDNISRTKVGMHVSTQVDKNVNRRDVPTPSSIMVTQSCCTASNGMKQSTKEMTNSARKHSFN